MIRYKLSRLFTRYAENFIPGDVLFGASAKIMEMNRDHYRDTLIESLQTLFGTFNSGLVLESENAGNGQAVLKISSPQKYPGLRPVEFNLSTETSNFLMGAGGREAAFLIKKDNQEKLFYYGNSWNPDNDSQFLGMPRYFAEVQEIAQHLRRETYDDLYARYQLKKERLRQFVKKLTDL